MHNLTLLQIYQCFDQLENNHSVCNDCTRVICCTKCHYYICLFENIRSHTRLLWCAVQTRSSFWLPLFDWVATTELLAVFEHLVNISLWVKPFCMCLYFLHWFDAEVLTTERASGLWKCSNPKRLSLWDWAWPRLNPDK